MAIKLFIVLVIAVTLLLPAISFRSFANSDKCKTTFCCEAKKKCIANKKEKAITLETETDPFTLLIPGNHF